MKIKKKTHYLECVDCKSRNYPVDRNARQPKDRIEIKKFCKVCKRHILHRETK